jgi:hypothetical protein
MITEEYLKDNFLTAYFVDNERMNIEIQTTTEDKKSVFTTIIPFKEENPQYQALNKFMTLDQLHESTFEKNKTEHELYKEQALKYAKEAGLVGNEIAKDNYFGEIVKLITEDQENEDHLFALKLAVFEIDAVKDSVDIEKKKLIRQSKTKADLVYNALSIILKK